MKKLLFLLLFPVALAHADITTLFGTGNIKFSYSTANFITPANGFSDYQTFMIPPQTQNTTILSSFPVLISGTFGFLKTTGNGGLVTETSGADIVFSTVGPGLTPYLNVETETYTNNTGAIDAWVQIPIIFSSQSVAIYMAYGNTTITSRVVWSTNTWDSNFMGVWHLPNGSTLGALDSTANANHGTITNAPTASVGQIDGGATFVTANSQSISIADNTTLKPARLTYSLWFKRNGNQANQQKRLIEKGTDATGPPFGSYFIQFVGGDASAFQQLIGVAGTATGWTTPAGTIADLTWYKAANSYDGSNVRSYFNGVLRNTVAGSGAISYDTNPLAFGASSNNVGGFGQFYQGSLDELRLSNIARSPDWERTEYNTETNSSLFCQLQAKRFVKIQ